MLLFRVQCALTFRIRKNLPLVLGYIYTQPGRLAVAKSFGTETAEITFLVVIVVAVATGNVRSPVCVYVV